VPDAQAILAHQIAPALMLNRSATVIAANEGSVRLLLPFRQNLPVATEGSLLGKNIADVALIPLPGASPDLCTWSSILAAAIDISESGAANRQNIRAHVSTTDLYQNTDAFWENEAEQQAIIESNIYVPRCSSQAGTPSANDSDDATSVVRARASVHWLSSNLDGVFLIIFNRTSLPHRTTPNLPAAVKDPINDFERQNDYQSLHSNLNDRDVHDECPAPFDFDLDSNDTSSDKTDTSDIAYAIIPHILATMDTDGKVVKLSKSWYSFSGLNEEESLGSGWLSIMFPDDVPEMTSAWADVVQNERSDWTHQARYRRASDGTFCWFLIRAEPYRDAKGEVLRWYASMMDIHEWIVARLKADIRRQSIITLFAQTDVMLWGIDKTNQMYICEGRLKWDPNRVVKLLESTRGEQDIPYTEALEETYRNPDQELVHTIQGVLNGRTFSPIVEHWEDDRYFRTRFVAEHVPPCVDGSPTSEDIVQAALALTFDITEEKARSVLLTENKKLVAKEKAALDASNLKSRFLANVSHALNGSAT
jgi:PAS domain S-box-containing protein